MTAHNVTVKDVLDKYHPRMVIITNGACFNEHARVLEVEAEVATDGSCSYVAITLR